MEQNQKKSLSDMAVKLRVLSLPEKKTIFGKVR